MRYIRVCHISRFSLWSSNISRVGALKLVMAVQVSGALPGAEGGIMSYIPTC